MSDRYIDGGDNSSELWYHNEKDNIIMNMDIRNSPIQILNKNLKKNSNESIWLSNDTMHIILILMRHWHQKKNQISVFSCIFHSYIVAESLVS